MHFVLAILACWMAMAIWPTFGLVLTITAISSGVLLGLTATVVTVLAVVVWTWQRVRFFWLTFFALLTLTAWLPTPGEAGTYDIRCDKLGIFLLATETLPAVTVQEDSVCRGRYDRGQSAHGNVWKVNFSLLDMHGSPIAAALMPDTSALRVRCLVDRVPVGPWQAGVLPGCDLTQPSLADPTKTILQTLRDGSHGLDLEVDWPGNSVRVSAILFTSGPPLGMDVPQLLAVCPTALDFAFGSIFSSGCATVPYPAPEPPDIEPWDRVSQAVPYAVFPGSTVTGGTQNAQRLAAYWVENIGQWGHQQILRNPVCHSPNRDGKEGPCRMSTANIQDYAFEDSRGTANPPKDSTGTSNYMTANIDGPRGIGTLPKVVDAHFCNGNVYTLSTSGRVGWLQARGPGAGRILTVAGYRIKPGHPGGYWKEFQSAQFNAHEEFYAEWMTGHTGPTTLNEPWGIEILDRVSCDAGTGAHHFLVADTKNNRIVYINHLPAHEPGGKPLLKVTTQFTDMALCRWPWTLATRPGTNWTYVACMLSHTIVRTRPTVAGEYAGDWETELVWESAKTVTREALGINTTNRGANERVYGLKSSEIRAAYHADGPPGVSSHVFGQALKWDSQGFLILCSRYGFACSASEMDPDVRKAAPLAMKFFAAWYALPEDSCDWRDINVDVNRHGGAGQLDMIRVVGWAQACSRAFTRQGQYLGALWPDAPTRTLITGQMAGAFQLQYPWTVLTNKDGEEIVFTSGDPGYGIIRRLRLPSDVPVDLVKYNAGHNIWKGGGGGPSFSLTHGQFGIYALGPMTVDTLGRKPDADICADYRTGLGTGIPRTLSDADCTSFVYWVRRTAKSTVASSPPPPPPPDFLVTLTTSGTGQGTVTGGGRYAPGQPVTLTATAAAGSVFVAWSPTLCDQRTFSMPAGDLACIGAFALVPPPPPPPVKPRVDIRCPAAVDCVVTVP